MLGNGFLWPLIYLGNRDQIRNPARIRPGMKLKVYQQYDHDEIQAALAAARDHRKLAAFLAAGALAAH